MSFWSNLSPVTKTLVVFLVLALLYFLLASVAGLPPFVEVVQATQQRGI
ncbi:MAG: hypothetical protein IPJ88_11315 [Myxococcales bacterium]|nr:MAG: hypothetical protein IPJ88_11315 [Myxococcales bacterium]